MFHIFLVRQSLVACSFPRVRAPNLMLMVPPSTLYAGGVLTKTRVRPGTKIIFLWRVFVSRGCGNNGLGLTR